MPLANIREIDKLRDDLVTSLFEQALKLSGALQGFRCSALEQCGSFREVSAQDHNIRLGGRKGGYSLLSYDGSIKIVIDNDTLIAVTEKVSVARDAILSCVRKWSDGANRNLVELVSRAFETDRQGHLSVARLLALRSYKIEGDPDWDAAMDALSQGLVASGSRTYVRFYRRDGASGKFKQIPLG